jgi:hypothetical protein
VIVNQKVWTTFIYNYNGGPEIVLSKNDDIYSSLVYINEKEIIEYSAIKENLLANSSNISTISNKWEIPVSYATKYKLELADKKSEKINLASDLSIMEDKSIILKEFQEKTQIRKNSKNVNK